MERIEKNKFTIIFTIILIILLVNTIRSIMSNRRSLSRIDDANEELTEIVNENDNLKEEIEFVQSDEYREKIALEQLNMTKPGYTVVVLEETPTLKEIEEEEAKEALIQEKPYTQWAEVFNLSQ